MIALLVSLAVLSAAALAYGMWQGFRLPESAPRDFQGRPARAPRLVCFGDSLTHGRVSYDWVGDLRRRLGASTEVINAGVNGDLSYNLLGRLPEVLACRPEHALVLIGTNDCCSESNESVARNYMRTKRLPKHPERAWYEENLRALVRGLHAGGCARVTLFTPPPLGEDESTPAHASLLAHCAVVERVAREEGCALVDLRAELAARLTASGHARRPGFHPGPREVWWLLEVPLLHHVLGLSYDRLSAAHGLYLSPDLIHLNERAGTVLAELAERAARADAPAQGPRLALAR